MLDYDDYKLNGEWHECICGRAWSDSDGGPCHIECTVCGELIDQDEDIFDRESSICIECMENLQEEE